MICGRLFNVWVNLLLALFLYGYSNKDSKRDAIITSKNIIYIYVFFGVSCGYEGGNHSRKCTICRYFIIHETSMQNVILFKQDFKNVVFMVLKVVKSYIKAFELQS